MAQYILCAKGKFLNIAGYGLFSQCRHVQTLTSAKKTDVDPTAIDNVHRELIEEIIRQVRNFVKGSTREATVPSDELMKSALYLLRTLPSAQDAVLEHLSNVFDDLINTYILNVELAKEPANDEAGEVLIQEVIGVLLALVKTNPDVWAPLMSHWAVDLLGHFSSKYSNRRALPRSATLTVVLQLWMSCQPTQALIEITTECFSSMIDRSPDICVDALLRASAAHSPHFDWVVAHIGSCYPKAIINRVFLLGLKDYHRHQSGSTGGSGSNQPNMSSVVGILGHLATQHTHSIHNSLMNLFMRSLANDASPEEQSAVPFILHLASLSPVLLRALATHSVNALNPEVLNSIANQFNQNKSLANQNKENLVQLIAHLVTRTEEGAYQVLQFLLNLAAPVQTDGGMDVDSRESVRPEVNAACGIILNHLVFELQNVIHSKSCDVSLDVPFLKSLVPHVSSICDLLAEAQGNRLLWLSRMLVLIAVHGHENVATDVLTQLVSLVNTPQQLSTFIKVQTEVEIQSPHIINAFVERIIGQLNGLTPSGLGSKIMSNLLQLTRWEQNRKDKHNLARLLLSQKLGYHLGTLTHWLRCDDFHQALVAMELINTIELPREVDMATLSKMCLAVTSFLFALMLQKGAWKLAQHVDMSIQYMVKLCPYGACQKILLRQLLEGAISKKNKALFGGKVSAVSKDNSPGPNESLMQSNQALNRSKGGAIVHTGVIGKGLRPVSRMSAIPKEHQEYNKQKVIEALAKCTCYHGNNQTNSNAMETGDVTMVEQWKISPEIAKYLALQVIEITTPDVMYNGIPWPEEDFMKVTVERDLQIKATYEDNPILWDIMEFLSDGPGAMCYCSVILRGILATIITHFEGSRESSAKNSPWQLDTACRIIEFMRKGQIVPSPLHHTLELLPHISPYNVFLLLINLWKYVKENPPVPISRMNVEIKCPPKYTDLIRFVIHSQIGQLGRFYPLFFGATKS